VVTLLLKDPHVNPSTDYNAAIRDASCNGHREIVEMLLKDNRVNPQANNNKALVYAIKNGHKEIVQMLLRSNRVYPSDKNNFAHYAMVSCMNEVRSTSEKWLALLK
jgi:ankyrin repeat protein